MTRALPDFSVVIPTFNRPRQLKACLAACADLDYPLECYEVIVVDDGGSTSLEPIVDLFTGRMKVALVRQENRGPAAARNTGAAQATGTFLAFLDDDCLPQSSWLKALGEQLLASPDCLVGGRTVNALLLNLFSTASQELVSYLYEYYNSDPNGARFFTSNNFSLSAAQFYAVGGFDMTFRVTAAEDREFCDRWLFCGHEMTYAKDALIEHCHAMTLATFWYQHYSYGRGACHYHQIRALRFQSKMAIEPFSFYFKLVRFPFTNFSGLHAWRISGLLLLAQCANVLGYFAEALRRLKPARLNKNGGTDAQIDGNQACQNGRNPADARQLPGNSQDGGNADQADRL